MRASGGIVNGDGVFPFDAQEGICVTEVGGAVIMIHTTRTVQAQLLQRRWFHALGDMRANDTVEWEAVIEPIDGAPVSARHRQHDYGKRRIPPLRGLRVEGVRLV